MRNSGHELRFREGRWRRARCWNVTRKSKLLHFLRTTVCGARASASTAAQCEGLTGQRARAGASSGGRKGSAPTAAPIAAAAVAAAAASLAAAAQGGQPAESSESRTSASQDPEGQGGAGRPRPGRPSAEVAERLRREAAPAKVSRDVEEGIGIDPSHACSQLRGLVWCWRCGAQTDGACPRLLRKVCMRPLQTSPALRYQLRRLRQGLHPRGDAGKWPLGPGQDAGVVGIPIGLGGADRAGPASCGHPAPADVPGRGWRPQEEENERRCSRPGAWLGGLPAPWRTRTRRTSCSSAGRNLWASRCTSFMQL